MTEHLDGVIVAGAGPVGLVTALVLARTGVPATVIDGEPEIIRSPRAIVYHDRMALGGALAAVINGEAADALLDGYADERRHVYREVTGPAAAENLRRMSETNPEKQSADRERLRRMHNDPAFQREALMFTYRLKGTPIRA
jgi:2-polyprenyl-6-methoxyphenol hydroxylase-like FAD-dependent oxidoreductase